MGFAILAAMNTSLLLVAHGSRREASNDEVRALTTRLRTAADEDALVVEALGGVAGGRTDRPV